MHLDKYRTVLHLLFLNNGYWKLFALVIAILVYFSIRSDISHVKVISVPIDVTNDSSAGDAAIWSVEPRSVKVKIRGSYNEISQLDDAAIKCVIRARQKSASILDTVRIKVRSKHIQGVRDARIIKIEPASIDVKFDIPDSVTLEVAPPAIEGNAHGSVRLSYDVTNAVIKGSRRLLQTLDVENTRIQCEPVDVDGRLESFVTRVRLVPPGDAANVEIDPLEMVVNVYITSENSSTIIESVPVIVSQPASSANKWITEPHLVNIKVSGRSELLKSVQFGDIMASVNGNIPVVPGLTNEVSVIVHVKQGLDVGTVISLPEKVKLIPLMQAESATPKTKKKMLN